MNAKNIIIGIVIGLIIGAGCTGGIAYKLAIDAERTSSTIIGQLRAEQQRSGELLDSIGTGIANCLEREKRAQGIFEKNRIILGQLREIIKSLPDHK